MAGDGKDNDCDGMIDEEKFNGEDDDNDGQIDEDLELVWKSLMFTKMSMETHVGHTE